MAKARPIKITAIKLPSAPKIQPIRVRRGPTVRWSIDYNKLFKNRWKK